MGKLDLEAVQRETHRRVAELVNTVTMETVKYIIGDDEDEATLSQMATNKAVEGDYVGAMICEVAAKHALKLEEPKKPLSRAVPNVEADLIVLAPTQAETVDDMLVVTGEVTLGAGIIRVQVFHHDAGYHLVGIKHREFDSDLVVKLSDTLKIKYVDSTVCETCGTPFTKKDIDGGRCLSCGSMIT